MTNKQTDNFYKKNKPLVRFMALNYIIRVSTPDGRELLKGPGKLNDILPEERCLEIYNRLQRTGEQKFNYSPRGSNYKQKTGLRIQFIAK